MHQLQILCEVGENPHVTCYRQLMGIMLCHGHKHSWFMHFYKNREDNGWQKMAFNPELVGKVLNLLQKIK
jgi:hypothetical protein